MQVLELMSVAPRSVWVTQSLPDAVSLFDHQNPAVVVVDLREKPVGVITKAAISHEAARNPGRWTRMRCAHLMAPLTCRLRAEDSLEEALAHYSGYGPRPLLVFDGDDLIGVLYPEYVLAATPASDRPPPPAAIPGTDSSTETL